MTDYAIGLKPHKHLLPSSTCPVCGKQFFMRCRKHEWGFWSESYDGGIVIFCSAKCADTYDRDRFLQSCRDVLQTKSFRAWKMAYDGKTISQISQELSISYNAVQHMLNWINGLRFREVEYLEAHNWEVAG